MTDQTQDEIPDSIEAAVDSVLDEDIDPGREDYEGLRELSRVQIEQLKSTTKLRESFAEKVYIFNIWWSSCVLLIILLSGFYFIPFYLSDKVLIAIIGTALVNVIGLIAIILIGLFKNS